jgi:hypothetical protein
MPADARKPYVYIAGPMTIGDVAHNTQSAVRAAECVLAWGGIPYVPHTTLLWHLISPHEHEYWMSLDLPWLRLCDVVIRLEGKSKGADREVAEAHNWQIPVVTFAGFLPWLEAWRAAHLAPGAADV